MRRLAALIAAGTLALSSAGGAAAQGASFKTSLTVNFNKGSGSFSGTVKSSKPACMRQRKVSVYRKRSGADQKVGSDSSSASGSWRVKVAGRPRRGDYYAKTKPATLSSGTCQAARSVVTHVS